MKNLQPLQSILFPKPYSLVDYTVQEIAMIGTSFQTQVNTQNALNDGSVFKEGEQEIYSSVYVYKHTGLLVGYQSIAEYHKDLDTVVIQFNNTANFDGYNWNLAEIIYGRIVKIVRKRVDED